MKKLHKLAYDFLRSEDGPTATEYAVLLAVIAITVLGAMASFGTRVEGLYIAITSATSSV
ncbi:MAG: Flp family type IVb pilin [Planctomycetota bacterium]|jgi:Flp pilus assembly pilin Flp